MRESILIMATYRLKETYDNDIKSKLQEDLKIDNVMATPRLLKVVINVGAGEAATNKNVLDKIQEQIGWISGQKPIITKARKSVAAYKIRKDLPIGVKVTLRGEKMYVFLEKLITIVMPRIRDFRGIPDSSVDSSGNMNLGFTEQTIFPEIEFDKIDRIRGLQVTIVTNARNYDNGRKLFEMMGIPFKKPQQ